jgi:hypothetical protein
VDTTARSNSSEEELKGHIAGKLGATSGSYHLHIKDATGRTADRFEVKKDWTYTISMRARMVKPDAQLAQIPLQKSILARLKSNGRKEVLVEVNEDWNEKRASEEFKTMTKISAPAPTTLKMADGQNRPRARFSMTPGFHYDIGVT